MLGYDYLKFPDVSGSNGDPLNQETFPTNYPILVKSEQSLPTGQDLYNFSANLFSPTPGAEIELRIGGDIYKVLSGGFEKQIHPNVHCIYLRKIL